MRILILGGTGFIGPHQVRYALARGHQVTIFNRGRQQEDWPGQVEELLGDRNTGDLKALEGRDWDVCIDNPTTLPFWVRDAGRVLKGHVEPVHLHLDDLGLCRQRQAGRRDRRAGGLQGRRPDGRDGQVAERRPAALRPAEGDERGRGAAPVRRGRHHDHPPGLIVGPGDETDRFTYWPVRLARGGEVLAPGDGSDPVQFIDARDLAEWTIRMAEARTHRRVQRHRPARPITMDQMLAGVAQGIHAHPKLVWAPTTFLKANKVSAWSDMPVWVPGQGETSGFHRRDIRRAMAAGLTYRPLPLTAADTLAWFRTLAAERQAKLRAGLTPEREAELLAKLKA